MHSFLEPSLGFGAPAGNRETRHVAVANYGPPPVRRAAEWVEQNLSTTGNPPAITEESTVVQI